MGTFAKLVDMFTGKEYQNTIKRLENQLIEVSDELDFYMKQFDNLNDAYSQLYARKGAHKDKYGQQRKRKKNGNLKMAGR